MAKTAVKMRASAKGRAASDLTFMDGMRDGYKWAATSDFFDIERFVNHVGWVVPYSQQRPWMKCPFPDLRETLESKGLDYSIGFIRGVQDCFQAEYSAFVFHRYREGTQDGQRWASEYASGEHLVRLRESAQSDGMRDIFVLPYSHEHFGLTWPANSLLFFLYEVGDMELYDREAREFWQPFVNEPMAKVLANLEHYGHRAGHKLQNRHYIAGFVDGALGLSEQLERRLNERTPTPPPKDGSISGE